MSVNRNDLLELLKAGQLAEAERLCRVHCEADDNAIDAWFLWGQVNGRLQNYQLAAACFHHILKREPHSAEAYYNLGKLYALGRQHDSAAANFSQAFQLKPDFAEACASLANAMLDLNDLDNAESLYSQALQLSPAFKNPYCYLSSPLEEPSDGSPYNTYRAYIYLCLGRVQRKSGKLEEARSSYQKALEIKPDYADARSNLLFLLSYHVLCSPQEMLEESQRWDHIHGREGRAHTLTHPTSDDPDRRLRIGYVSPDFLHHPVSYFLEPILAGHDRQQVEVFCYAEVKHPDIVTQRLQALADQWRSTVGMADDALARLIFDDHIDILIDLAGHTAGNRLKTFTYKPAPIQATYLGYFATTGLVAMDYWITDEILHPQNTPGPPHWGSGGRCPSGTTGTAELATESLYRLPRCCLVYRAAPEAPEVAERSDGGIVFGSFNQMSKTSLAAVELWAQILQAVPQARLLIKTRLMSNSKARSTIQKQFAAHGIIAERLILLSHVPSQREHLAIYGRVDIALDTIPRTGGSTTADTLWMGVPVITLAGECFIERLSASMLNAVGLDELIADSKQDYVDKAVALAGDPERRARLRTSLRERMAKSPLCDGRGLAQALETAYRDMWKTCLVENAREH